MPKVVKSYDERYSEFLDVAQHLFYSKSYEQTSVNDIIKTVGVAKGTFYHYFESKSAILEALVERIGQQLATILQVIVDDDTLTSLEKFEQFFATTNQWKVMRKEDLLITARILYQDDNVLLREKLRYNMLSTYSPMLSTIIVQGTDEGFFDVMYPSEIAKVIFALSRNFSEALIHIILSDNQSDDDLLSVKRELAVLNISLTRILGMQEGTLSLANEDDILDWFS